jgi:2-polyprenyl-6-methoxyphenol hydroxylase-like FAD-dependent oxidoreductase
MKIVCVGGGPAGLYASILLKLRDPRQDITIFERSNAGSTAGSGVTLGRDLLARLYEQDRESADLIYSSAFIYHEQAMYSRGEKVVVQVGEDYNITRQRLTGILAGRATALGVHMEYGKEIVSLSQLPEADLIIAADGVNSRVRSEAEGFQTTVTSGTNKYIWLGTDKVFDSFNFIFVPANTDWIWAHTFGVGTESSALVVECTAAAWTELGFDSLSVDNALPIIEGLFKDCLDGHQLTSDLGDGSKARWLSFKTVSNERWHSGKIVLIGDSAHSSHFSVGMGTTLAIEDAVALADNLHRHDDLELALESYERRRIAESLPILTGARYSERWFENISRYMDLSPRQLGVLFGARRSPITPLLPPRVSYALLTAKRLASSMRSGIGWHQPRWRPTLAASSRDADTRSLAADPGQG